MYPHSKTSHTVSTSKRGLSLRIDSTLEVMGLHASTSQLNLSRLCHRISMKPLSVTIKSLTISRKVGECKPLLSGSTAIRVMGGARVPWCAGCSTNYTRPLSAQRKCSLWDRAGQSEDTAGQCTIHVTEASAPAPSAPPSAPSALTRTASRLRAVAAPGRLVDLAVAA